jgi:transcriptional regulator with XRE-family HTH domain
MALAPEEVGARIRQARLAKGWTHDDLAAAMDVNSRTVQRWQKGRDPATGKVWLPRLKALMRLADVLEVSQSYFVRDEEADRRRDEDGDDWPEVLARMAKLETQVGENSRLLSELLQALRGGRGGGG